MKQRLDVLLVSQGLSPTRSHAQARIMAGEVLVNGQRATKSGERYPVDTTIHLSGPANPYVSRGGLKLEGALGCFPVVIAGKVCVDVGASTGGFTDYLLQQGASRVFAVDVGRGQLHWRLRQDPRVTVLEGVNARRLEPGLLGNIPMQLAVIDVSFISLALIFPAVKPLVAREADVLALVKPQFEAGRREAQRGRGVIRDPQVHQAVLSSVVAAVSQDGWHVQGLTHSPLVGPRGNLEFWLWLRREPARPGMGDTVCCKQAVERAHAALRQEG